MHLSPPIIIDALNDLEDPLAARFPILLREISDALEHHYADAVARQQQRELESRQTSLCPGDEPPF